MKKKLITIFLVVFFAVTILNLNEVFGVGLVSQAWKRYGEDNKLMLIFRTYTSPASTSMEDYHKTNSTDYVQDGNREWTYNYQGQTYKAKWVYFNNKKLTKPYTNTYSTLTLAFHTDKLAGYEVSGRQTKLSSNIGYTNLVAKEPGVELSDLVMSNEISSIKQIINNSESIFANPYHEHNYDDKVFYEVPYANATLTKVDWGTGLVATELSFANNIFLKATIVNIDGTAAYIIDNVVYGDHVKSLVIKANEAGKTEGCYVTKVAMSQVAWSYNDELQAKYNAEIGEYSGRTSGAFEVAQDIEYFFEQYEKGLKYYGFWGTSVLGYEPGEESANDNNSIGSVANHYDNEIIFPQQSKRAVLVRHIDVGTNTTISTEIINNSTPIESTDLTLKANNVVIEGTAESETEYTRDYQEYYEDLIAMNSNIVKEALQDTSTYKCIGHNVAVSTSLQLAENTLDTVIANGQYNRETKAEVSAKDMLDDGDYIVIDFYYTEYDKQVEVNHIYLDKDGKVIEKQSQTIIPNQTALSGEDVINRINNDTYVVEKYIKSLGKDITVNTATSLTENTQVEYLGYETFKQSTSLESISGVGRISYITGNADTAKITGDIVQVNFYYYQYEQVEVNHLYVDKDGYVIAKSKQTITPNNNATERTMPLPTNISKINSNEYIKEVYIKRLNVNIETRIADSLKDYIQSGEVSYKGYETLEQKVSVDDLIGKQKNDLQTGNTAVIKENILQVNYYYYVTDEVEVNHIYLTKDNKIAAMEKQTIIPNDYAYQDGQKINRINIDEYIKEIYRKQLGKSITVMTADKIDNTAFYQGYETLKERIDVESLIGTTKLGSQLNKGNEAIIENGILQVNFYYTLPNEVEINHLYVDKDGKVLAIDQQTIRPNNDAIINDTNQKINRVNRDNTIKEIYRKTIGTTLKVRIADILKEYITKGQVDIVGYERLSQRKDLNDIIGKTVANLNGATVYTTVDITDEYEQVNFYYYAATQVEVNHLYVDMDGKIVSKDKQTILPNTSALLLDLTSNQQSTVNRINTDTYIKEVYFKSFGKNIIASKTSNLEINDEIEYLGYDKLESRISLDNLISTEISIDGTETTATITDGIEQVNFYYRVVEPTTVQIEINHLYIDEAGNILDKSVQTIEANKFVYVMENDRVTEEKKARLNEDTYVKEIYTKIIGENLQARIADNVKDSTEVEYKGCKVYSNIIDSYSIGKVNIEQLNKGETITVYEPIVQVDFYYTKILPPEPEYVEIQVNHLYVDRYGYIIEQESQNIEPNNMVKILENGSSTGRTLDKINNDSYVKEVYSKTVGIDVQTRIADSLTTKLNASTVNYIGAEVFEMETDSYSLSPRNVEELSTNKTININDAIVQVNFYYYKAEQVEVNHLYIDKDGYVLAIEEQNIIPNTTAVANKNNINRLNSEDRYIKEIYPKTIGVDITVKIADSLVYRIKSFAVEYMGHEVLARKVDTQDLIGKLKDNLNTNIIVNITDTVAQVNYYYYIIENDEEPQEVLPEQQEPQKNIGGSVFVNPVPGSVSTTCLDTGDSIQIVSVPSGSYATVGITGVPRFMVGAITTKYVTPKENELKKNITLTFKMGNETKIINYYAIKYRTGYFKVTDMAVFGLKTATIFDAQNGTNGTLGTSIFNWTNGKLDTRPSNMSLVVKLTGLNNKTIANNSTAINDIDNYVIASITYDENITYNSLGNDVELSKTYLTTEQFNKVNSDGDDKIDLYDKVFASKKLSEYKDIYNVKLNTYNNKKEVYEELVANTNDTNKELEQVALEELETARNEMTVARADYNNYYSYAYDLNVYYGSYKVLYDEFMSITEDNAAAIRNLKLNIRVQNMSVAINDRIITKASNNVATGVFNVQDMINNRKNIPEVATEKPVIDKNIYTNLGTENIKESDYTNSNYIEPEKTNGIRALGGNVEYEAKTIIGSKGAQQIQDTVYYSDQALNGKIVTFKLNTLKLSQTYKVDTAATNATEKYKQTKPINIYTPITVSATMASDTNEIINQSQNTQSNTSMIQLNTSFTIDLGNSVKPAEYNINDTNKYNGGYYVKFNFDVHNVYVNGRRYNNGNIVKAGTWIGIITKKGNRAYITAQAYGNLDGSYLNTVSEDNSSYVVRAVAYNTTDLMLDKSIKFDNLQKMIADTSELKETVFNICKNPSYFAETTYNVILINRAFEFRITDLKDVNWKSVFRTTTGSATNKHRGVVYYSGSTRWNTESDKSNDIVPRTVAEIGRNPLKILPLGPYKNTDSTYSKAPKMGYRFSFDMKVTGSYYNNQGAVNQNKKVNITTKFYYVSKDGKTYLKEYDGSGEGIYLFYKTSDGKYVRIDENGGGYKLTFTPNDGYRYIQDNDTSTLSKKLLTLGNLRRITLTHDMATVASNGSIITYYGEYKLPNSTIAVKVNADGTYNINKPLAGGYVGVIFDIVAYSGTVKLDGVTKDVQLSYHKDTKAEPNTSQWDYEGFLGYTNYGQKVSTSSPVTMRLENGTWKITDKIYNEIKGSVILYDLDQRAATDYE